MGLNVQDAQLSPELQATFDAEITAAREARDTGRVLSPDELDVYLGAARDGYFIQPATDDQVIEALDQVPEVPFREAIEALKAAPPIQESQAILPLTRQAARRMAIQLCWARLGGGVPQGGPNRAARRRMMFGKDRIFNFSDIARGLVTTPGTPVPLADESQPESPTP